MNIARMAWRNLWRNGRRTVVTVVAMTFALWVMILYSGMVEGYLRGMERDLIDLELGDVQIHAPEYRDNPSIFVDIASVDALLLRLDAAGVAASARLQGGGLAAAGDASAGVRFTGIDPTRDARASSIHARVARGAWVDAADPDGVVIGSRLARILAVDVGDEVLVLSQGRDGSVANALFEVRGVLGTVSDGLDRGQIFMPEQAFRDLMTMPEGAHELLIRRPPELPLDVAAARVRDAAPGLDVSTWRDLNPTLAMMLDGSRALMGVVFFIVYIAIAILVLNAMLMSVFERIRELGVMKAIGFGPGALLGMIALETMLQTSLAAALGVTLALPAMYYLSAYGVDTGALGGMSVMGMTFVQRWKGVYDADLVVRPILALAVMVAVAAAWPALKAAFISPISAMRHR
jgi:ABC-type lipoprotein release transport system permease subunit